MRRFLLSLIGLLVATVLLITWIASQERVQDALGQFASRIATAALGRQVQIGWVAWEPLRGAFSAGDLAVLGDEGDLLVGVDYLTAAIRWGAIAPGVFDFREVGVYGLHGDIEIDEAGAIHPFAELTAPTSRKWPDVNLPEWLRKLLPEPGGASSRVRVETLRIEDANLRFSMSDPDMEARASGLNAVIQIEDDMPRSFVVSVDRGYYRILDWSYDDIRINGHGGVRDDGVFFREVDVVIGRPAIDARAGLDIPLNRLDGQPLVAIDAEAQLDLQLVNQHYTPIPVFLGTADAGVDISIWPDRGIEMTGRLTAERMLMQGGIVSDLAVDVYLDNGHIEFPGISARLEPAGTLAATGTVNWYDDVVLAFSAQTSNVADIWGRAFGGPLPLAPSGRQSGQTVFTMDFDPDWALHLRSNGLLALDRFELLPGSPASPADVDYRLQLEAQPDLVQILAPYIDGGWFAATAEVTVATDAPEAYFRAAGTATVTALDRLGLQGIAPVAGIGGGSWAADAQAIQVRAEASPFALWQSRWDRAVGVLHITTDGQLDIPRVEAYSGKGSVHGRLSDDGSTLRTFLRVREVDFAHVFGLEQASGIADGTIDVEWPYRSLLLPWLTGDLSLRDLSWHDIVLDDLTARLRRSGRLYGGEILGDRTALTIGGDIEAALLTVDGRITARPPENIAGTLSVDAIEADAHVRVAGRDGFGHFLARGAGRGDLGAGGVWDGKRFLGWLIGAGERLRGRAIIRAGEGWSVGGEVVADLSGRWFDSIDDPAGRVRLLATGRGRDPDTIDGIVSVDQGSAKLAGVDLSQTGAARITIDRGEVELIHPVHVKIGDSGAMEIGGGLDKTRLDLHLDGQIPLDILALEAVGVRLARGTLSTDVQLRGSWEQPRLYGQGVLDATRLALVDLDEPVEDLTGTFSLTGERLRLDGVRGRIGDGTLSVVGDLAVMGPDRGQLQLGLQLSSSAVRINEKLRTGIIGDVRLEGRAPDDLLLSGALELAGLRYSDDLTWERLLLQVGGSRAPVPSRYHGVGLALDVRGSRDLRLNTGLLNGGMRMQLHLSGTTVRPVIDGVVDLDRGNEFFFRGRIYQIARGSIQFLGDERNQPFLDIEAETEARYRGDQGEQNYRIRLLMFGPADQLNVRFESVPPLPEDDVLALLSLGILASDLRVDRVDGLELSSILLSQQISQIEREVQMLTGFDRIEIEPAYDNSRGASSMQITLEKRLNERLRLRLSTALDVNADQRVELGYSLLRGIDLSAGWDNRSGGTIGNFYVRPRVVVPLP